MDLEQFRETGFHSGTLIYLLAQKKIREQQNRLSSENKVVYFPSCINRALGVSKENRKEKQLSEKMVGLLNKGGFEVIYPENLDNLFCGMFFFE